MDFRMFPLRDYTEAELLALPADSRLLFADDLASGLLVYDGPRPVARGFSSRRRRVLKHPSDLSHAHLTSALARVRALRCISHGLSTFSLYPTTDQEHRVNRFLWQAANDFSFSAATAATLFQRNVFIISMPATLFDFLTTVTWEQLEQAMLFVLVSLAADPNDLQILHEELAPVLVAKLARGSPPHAPPDGCEPYTFRLLLDLVMDRIVWMGPWVVPTTLCYLSASDMTELLAHNYQRPIFATPEKFELVHTMMWNIFRDWQTYRHILVKMGGYSRLDALELMARTISKGTQSLVDKGIRTLLQMTAEEHSCDDIPFDVTGLKTPLPLPPRPLRKSFFSMLPRDVVLGKLLPKLCEVHASDDNLRRRTPVTPTAAPDANADAPSPVAVPFSLKSWVLEDHNLHQFYHESDEDEDEDEEMSEAEPVATPEDEGMETVADDDAMHDVDIPRTQRRRLNEQGSFQVVSSAGASSRSNAAAPTVLEALP